MDKTLIKQITGLTDHIEENVGKKRKHLMAGIYSVKFRVCIVILILLITTSLTLTAFLQKESTVSAHIHTTVATTTPSPSLIKDVYGSEKGGVVTAGMS